MEKNRGHNRARTKASDNLFGDEDADHGPSLFSNAGKLHGQGAAAANIFGDSSSYIAKPATALFGDADDDSLFGKAPQRLKAPAAPIRSVVSDDIFNSGQDSTSEPTDNGGALLVVESASCNEQAWEREKLREWDRDKERETPLENAPGTSDQKHQLVAAESSPIGEGCNPEENVKQENDCTSNSHPQEVHAHDLSKDKPVVVSDIDVQKRAQDMFTEAERTQVEGLPLRGSERRNDSRAGSIKQRSPLAKKSTAIISIFDGAEDDDALDSTFLQTGPSRSTGLRVANMSTTLFGDSAIFGDALHDSDDGLFSSFSVEDKRQKPAANVKDSATSPTKELKRNSLLLFGEADDSGADLFGSHSIPSCDVDGNRGRRACLDSGNDVSANDQEGSSVSRLVSADEAASEQIMNERQNQILQEEIDRVADFSISVEATESNPGIFDATEDTASAYESMMNSDEETAVNDVLSALSTPPSDEIYEEARDGSEATSGVSDQLASTAVQEVVQDEQPQLPTLSDDDDMIRDAPPPLIALNDDASELLVSQPPAIVLHDSVVPMTAAPRSPTPYSENAMEPLSPPDSPSPFKEAPPPVF